MEWGKTVDGMKCGVVSDKRRYTPSERIRLKLQLRVEERTGTVVPKHRWSHILLPRKVSENHIISIVAKDRSGREIPYRGRQHSGGLGHVSDLTLTPGRVIPRSFEISRWFDFTPDGSPFRVAVLIQPWSYETELPHYWMGTLESNEIEIRIQ